MIACLGWGSLIWDPRDLPVEGDWHFDGPQLPVEFTRVSGGGRLTLVITEGAPVVSVLWSSLSVTSLDEGIQVLADREDIPAQNVRRSVGVWSATWSSRHTEAATIGEWAKEHNLTAVIWTALKPGFPGARGKALACQEALDHLRNLEGAERDHAEEYIRRAPLQVSTPYRTAIEREFGWTAV